ncbi:unnamed protein product, partial [Symbiodinium pilosum]
AVNDIYETVQRWHSKEHREMMRAHFQGTAKGKSQLPRAGSGVFSVTPTLDAHEATVFALNETESTPQQEVKSQPEGRGAASRHIEEAQLRLAVELSKKEAEHPEKQQTAKAQEGEDNATTTSTQTAGPQEAEPKQHEVAPAKAQDLPDFQGLPLRGEGGLPAAQVFIKPHCLAARVEALPDALERSIESIVHKLVTPDSWALLYESITEERSYACARAARPTPSVPRMLVLWLEDVATDTAKLQESPSLAADAELRLNGARHDFLKHAMLEWCELEDLTEFLDAQLGPLEMAIDNFRGSQEVNTAHTPHVRDIGRLMFRNHCLLDSRVFRPLCLAAYALVHEAGSRCGGCQILICGFIISPLLGVGGSIHQHLIMLWVCMETLQ